MKEQYKISIYKTVEREKVFLDCFIVSAVHLFDALQEGRKKAAIKYPFTSVIVKADLYEDGTK